MFQTVLYNIFMIIAIIFMIYIIASKIYHKFIICHAAKTIKKKVSKIIDSVDVDAIVEKINQKTDKFISNIGNDVKKSLKDFDKKVPNLKEGLEYIESNYLDRFERFWTDELKPILNSELQITYKLKKKKENKSSK